MTDASDPESSADQHRCARVKIDPEDGRYACQKAHFLPCSGNGLKSIRRLPWLIRCTSVQRQSRAVALLGQARMTPIGALLDSFIGPYYIKSQAEAYQGRQKWAALVQVASRTIQGHQIQRVMAVQVVRVVRTNVPRRSRAHCRKLRSVTTSPSMECCRRLAHSFASFYDNGCSQSTPAASLLGRCRLHTTIWPHAWAPALTTLASSRYRRQAKYLGCLPTS
jgi:hypothetical protein